MRACVRVHGENPVGRSILARFLFGFLIFCLFLFVFFFERGDEEGGEGG